MNGPPQALRDQAEIFRPGDELKIPCPDCMAAALVATEQWDVWRSRWATTRATCGACCSEFQAIDLRPMNVAPTPCCGEVPEYMLVALPLSSRCLTFNPAVEIPGPVRYAPGCGHVLAPLDDAPVFTVMLREKPQRLVWGKP
jgi:hypothetical protein